MRVFLSCNLPDCIKEYTQSLPQQISGTTFTIPKQPDLTIKFFGNISENTVEAVIARLSNIQCTPFVVRLDGLHTFDEPIPKTVWVGLTPTQPLISLHDTIEEALMPKRSSLCSPHHYRKS